MSRLVRFLVTAILSGALGIEIAALLSGHVDAKVMIFVASALGGNLGPVLVDMVESYVKRKSP